MLFSPKVFLTVSLLLTEATALVVPRGGVEDASDYKIGFNVKKDDAAAFKKHKLDNVPITSYNGGAAYHAHFLLGSEQVDQDFLLDFGSSQTWVKDTSCGGKFDTGRSSSFKWLGVKFDLSAFFGLVFGKWSSDILFFGDSRIKLPSFPFAVVDKSSIDFNGVIGIGHKSSLTPYNNLPYVLKNQGKISTAGYSCYFDNSAATSGALLFGFIDKAKYSGSLISFSVKTGGLLQWLGLVEAAWEAVVDFVTINDHLHTKGHKLALDFGSTITYLPKAHYDYIVKEFGGDLCNPPKKNLSFNIGGAKIEIPYSDLVVKVDGEWVFAIEASTDLTIALGANFLKHAYVAYNFEKKKISLAKVKYTDDCHIVSL